MDRTKDLCWQLEHEVVRDTCGYCSAPIGESEADRAWHRMAFCMLIKVRAAANQEICREKVKAYRKKREAASQRKDMAISVLMCVVALAFLAVFYLGVWYLVGRIW